MSVFSTSPGNSRLESASDRVPKSSPTNNLAIWIPFRPFQKVSSHIWPVSALLRSVIVTETLWPSYTSPHVRVGFLHANRPFPFDGSLRYPEAQIGRASCREIVKVAILC